MDDSRGVWHDFKTDDGGGVLALVVQVRGGSRQNALHWLADLTGTPLGDQPLPPVESTKLASERWKFERDLPAARYWRRAAIAMSEELLAVLKTAFFDPTAESDVTGAELRNITQKLACLKRLDGVELVAEYRWWGQRDPQLTAGLVGAADTLETAERRALLAYLRTMALGASE